MATIRTGGIVQDIRGSVGTLTYARNRGGLYVRDRTYPDETASPLRTARQNFFRDLQKLWATTMPEAVRNAWRTWCRANPTLNALGQVITTHPLAAYCRYNFWKGVFYGSTLTWAPQALYNCRPPSQHTQATPYHRQSRSPTPTPTSPTHPTTSIY